MAGEHDPDAASLAEDRTDLAEDRTLLANERTFSGWARTAMASIGIAIGFHALFKPVEPTWVAKAVATLFLLLAALIAIAAQRRAAAVRVRLSAHQITPLPAAVFAILAGAIVTGAAALTVVLWWLT